MLDMISKFLDYVTGFFDTLFSLPASVISLVGSLSSFLDVFFPGLGAVVLGSIVTIISTLIIFTIVKLVVSLL